jgi:transcriptional regulator NrdR family protein
MTIVLKVDGSKQAFSAAKLKVSIEKACMEADFAAERVRELVEEISEPIIKEVEKKSTIKSSELRKLVLAALDKGAKPAAKAWRRFDKDRGREE